MSEQNLKEIPMSEWGIGDYAMIGEAEVLITAIDGPDCCYKRVFPGDTFGPETNGKTEDLTPIPAGSTAIPPRETVAAEVTEILAQNGIFEDRKPQPTWEQVLMIPPAPSDDLSKLEPSSLSALSDLPNLQPVEIELTEDEARAEYEAYEALRLIEQPDVTDEQAAQIAQLELDLAQERDELAQKLAEALEENARLNGLLSDEQSEHDKTRKDRTDAMNLNSRQSTMLHEASVIINEREQELERLKLSQPSGLTAQRPRKEQNVVVNPGLIELTDLINDGWEVVFETIYVLPNPTHAQGASSYHMLRLEREAQTPAYPPQDEARVGSSWEGEEPKLETVSITPDTPDEPPAETPEDVPAEIVIDAPDMPDALPAETPEPDEEPELEPMGQGATVSPLTSYMLNQSARSPRQTGATMIGRKPRNMQQRGKPGPQYAADAIPHEEMPDGTLRLGGWLNIDPKKMPMVATMMQHGAEALNAGLDQQVMGKVQAAMAAVQAQQSKFKRLPPLGLGNS